MLRADCCLDGQIKQRPDDLTHANTIWADGIAHGTPVETVVRIRAATGEYRSFLSRATPIRDAAGHVTRWTAVMVAFVDFLISFAIISWPHNITIVIIQRSNRVK